MSLPHQPMSSKPSPTSSLSFLEHVMLQLVSLVLICLHVCHGAAPRFDPTTLMRLVLVPVDAQVGSVVYRLRATDEDFDYPLQFDLVGDAAKSIVSIDTLACTKFNSICQANVVLKRRLEAGRYYDFQVTVRDTKGGKATISCSISATNATTPKDTIFPHIPSLIMVPEDTKRGKDLEYVIARKNPRFIKPVYMELWGSPLFAIRQRLISSEESEGTIFLLGPLDYEKQATYHLSLLANDAYAEPGQDSRNIAALEVVVVVVDVQDMPPIFTLAPPITKLNNSLLPGDIVARVHAEDGDKGNPRDIRYGLVSEGNPFTPFFNISETNGEIILARPLEEITAISHVGDPIILTVVAEEVRLARSEPEAMSTTVQLAFILGDRGNQPPYFANDNYVARIDENSPQGSTLIFAEPYIPEVNDDDMGKNGVFALTLDNNNGTFEISPNVGERHAEFLISVRDNSLLDYETTKTVRFKIIAQELGPITNLSSSVDVVVFLNNINDNAPVFDQNEYFAEIPENATAGTRVTQVRASDPDTDGFGRIRYTQIIGHLNSSLSLDSETGIITIATNNHGFDCEVMTEYRLYVEATDANGTGNKATVPLIIKLIDVNDETPRFERSLYEFVLSASLTNFTFPAFIKAIDNDVTAPNNIVRYEFTQGNYENRFALNEITGELTLRKALTIRASRQKRETEVYILTARAYDLGVPHLSSTCEINVYPPESRVRTMLFIVPGARPDRGHTEEMLTAITGGKVTIQEIRPYKGDEVGATDVTAGDTSNERSVVVASVSYNKNSIVDVSQIQNKLGRNRTVVVGNTYTEDKNIPYRAESNVLFWLLMFLAFLIIIGIIILVLCCICAGCPLYVPPKKRIVRVNSTDDDVHLVVKEKGFGRDNKSLHATRKEAWSADMADARTRPTHWQFDRRNIRTKEDADRMTVANSAFVYKPKYMDETRSLRDGPHIIYNRDVQNRTYKTNERDIYIEDYETPKSHMKKRIHMEDDLETESLQRHEMERGSDRVYRRMDDTGSFRPSFRRQPADDQLDDGREQLFIREGNTEILRLITRGGQDDEKSITQQQQRPVTLVQQPQYILVDSGKHLLMERFIEQQLLQQQEQSKHSNAPSVANEKLDHQSIKDSISSSSIAESKRTAYNLINQELLETSLRQQNELLKQLLIEKERLDQKQTADAQLETQSLPGHSVMAMATQTDVTTSTQTDPQYLRPPKRQIRSDNDDSGSDDDFHVYIIKQSDDVNGIRWVKKRKKYKRRRARDVAQIKRLIKTPILEESESQSPRDDKSKMEEKKNYYETRTSMLRRKKNEEVAEAREEQLESEYSRKSPLKKDILIEITESLEQPKEKTKRLEYDDEDDDDTNEEECKLYAIKAGKLAELFSDDSLNDEIEEIQKNVLLLDKQHSIPQGSSTETRLTNSTEKHPSTDKEQPEIIRKPDRKETKKKADTQKSTPRYMQWYKNKEEQGKKKDEAHVKKPVKKVSKSLLADTKSSSIKKVYPVERKTDLKKDPEVPEKKVKIPHSHSNESTKSTNEQPQLPTFHPLVQHSEYRYEHPKSITTGPTQYLVSVGIPPPNLAPTYLQPTDTQPHQISVQSVETTQKMAPNKPIRPSLQKDPSIGKIGQQPIQKAPGGGGIEEDYDSGIAMATLAQDAKKRNQMTEKKSIFTIAYDDVHTKQLRPDSTTPPY